MSDDLRLISFEHGDHICLFYNDIGEQMSVAAPFVKAGLLRGELCLSVLTRKQTERLCSILRADGINPQKELSRGALLFASPQDAYRKGGKFDREAMLQLLNNAMQEAVDMGFTGFRGTGDLSWASRDSGICGELPEYEAMLDKYYPGTKSLGICMYDIRLFSAEQLARLMKAHGLAISHPGNNKRAIRIRRDGIFGDVVFDRVQPCSLFHYVIQKDDSEKILLSGQDVSLSGAMNAVEAFMASLHRA